jgi:hypothetical protein
MSKLPPISKLSDNPLARRAAGKLREGHSQLTSKAIETVLLEGKSGGKSASRCPASWSGWR